MKSSKKNSSGYESRMMVKILVYIVFASILTGCAPRVISDMYTYEFAPLPPDSV